MEKYAGFIKDDVQILQELWDASFCQRERDDLLQSLLGGLLLNEDGTTYPTPVSLV